MKYLFRVIAVCVLFMCSTQLATAQGIDLGLNILGGFPRGEFRSNVGSDGIGLDGIISYNLPQSPLSFGLNLGFITYGNDRRSEAFNPNIPEVRVDVETSNNIFTGHFFTRLEPFDGPISPYADALAGLHYLFTESTVSDDDDLAEPIARTTNFDDSAFSYGFGGGLKFKVAESEDKKSGTEFRWYIDLQARYLYGGDAEYLRKGSIERVNGDISFDTQFSRTNLLTVGLGVIVNIR